MQRLVWIEIGILVCLVLLSSCASPPVRQTLEPTATTPAPETATPTASQQPTEQPTEEFAAVSPTQTQGPQKVVMLPLTGHSVPPSATPLPTRTPTITATPTRTSTPTLNPENWKYWPVLPSVSVHLREVYERGLRMGNDPNAFSILGDCQSQPEVFMGLYDNDPDEAASMPIPLQETIEQFSGSFDRYSPTVKDGTTEGALLWAEWNDNKEKKCEPGETPLECELRVHRPSIVFIHVGTHYEARNERYLTIIIERVLEHGAVPVMVTKADNTELDERVNSNIVALAAAYDLPLWNFWASVQHLPEGGMLPGSNKYLNDEAVIIHREDALQALDIVWRAVR